MTETVSVLVSGAAFSLLLYENVKSEHDQEGFLLGNVISKETNKLTDADHRVVNKQRIIKVNSALPCPQLFYFYDAAGKINADKIASMLNGLDGSVVGWYIYTRKRGTPKLTLREKIIHKQLADFFCPNTSVFTCCLLNSNSNEIRSTYSFCQTFLRYHMSRFDGLPLHVINLSDPSYTLKTAEPASDLLNKIVKSVKSTGESEGHLVIEKVQESLQGHMKKLVTELAKKEQELFKYEQEVKQLQYNLKMKREYGFDEKENDQDALETEVVENGALESESSQNTRSSCVENTTDNPKKNRGRPRRQVNSLPNSVIINPTESSDIVGDHLKVNETVTTVTPMANRLRAKSSISYAEIAQKRKN